MAVNQNSCILFPLPRMGIHIVPYIAEYIPAVHDFNQRLKLNSELHDFTLMEQAKPFCATSARFKDSGASISTRHGGFHRNGEHRHPCRVTAALASGPFAGPSARI
jgi:hypothetical protein